MSVESFSKGLVEIISSSDESERVENIWIVYNRGMYREKNRKRKLKRF